MKKTHKLIALLTASLAIMVACKTTDQNNSAPDSSLTEQKSAGTTGFQHKQINELTEQERNAFNETTTRLLHDTMYTDDMMLATCSLETAFSLGFSLDDNLTEAEMQSACAESRDECIADMKETRNAQEKTNPVASMKVPAHCSFTVQEFEDCVHGLSNNYKRLVSNFTACESHTIESIQAFGTGEYPLANLTSPLSPACEIVHAKCPEAF